MLKNPTVATAGLVDLEACEANQSQHWAAAANRHLTSAMLFDLVRRLTPLDRQVILLYLEGEAAAEIAEATGLTAVNVATKIHRIKRLLKQQQTEGDEDAARRLSRSREGMEDPR